MKRLLMPLVVFVTVLMSAPISASAVNLHNGYIRIVNDTDGNIFVDVLHVVFGRAGTFIQRVQIPRHGSVDVNKCCFAAGSEYQLNAEWSEGQYVDGRLVRYVPGESSLSRVTLRLCNEQGIPHGYAFVKAVIATEGNKRIMHVIRLDEACP